MVTVGLLIIASTTALFATGACSVIGDNSSRVRLIRSPYPRRTYLPTPPGQSPECAKNGQTYCENISDYPGDLIYKLLKNSKLNYKKFLVSETDDDVPPQIKLASIQGGYPKYEDPELRQLDQSTVNDLYELEYVLFDDMEDFENLINSENEAYLFRTKRQLNLDSENHGKDEDSCLTVNAMVMPRVAMNTAKEWRYVVNMPELGDDIQMVKMQNCHSSVHGRTCPNPCDNRPYVTKCATDFLEKKLMSLDPTGEDIVLETFMIPVGCYCKEDN